MDLSDFPTFRLLPEHRLFRIHRAGYGPWWFSSSGDGRFDLRPPLGTCYLAEEPVGAFIEVFQGFDEAVPHADVRARRISTLSVPRVFRLADCANSLARRSGITGEIHSMTTRRQTQQWARAFADAGFDGIRFLVRHDPAQQRVGFALFGPAGEASWDAISTDEIGTAVIIDVERRFGIRVQS